MEQMEKMDVMTMTEQGAVIDTSKWAVPEAATAHAVYLTMKDATSDAPVTRFTIPAGRMPNVGRAYVLTIVSHLPRPNWWFRMWSRLLLGIVWTVEPKD